MIIKSVNCSDFRNLETLSLELSPGINVLYGNNAQGKTNILEAAYVCATSRSHRGAKDREMIRFNKEEAHIRLTAEKKETPVRIDTHLKKGRSKGIAIEGMPIRKVSALFGLLNVVFFSPEDLSIIKNSPGERRRFMDLELCQLDPYYTYDLTNYNRTLLQRNKLLKELEEKPELFGTLSVWDEQLVKFGSGIIRKREEFLRELNILIDSIHRRLTGDKEILEVKYLPNVSSNEKFEDALSAGLYRDRGAKTTLCGPHRDDIAFFIEGIDIRHFGSQGQQRTAALSLKLSEIELVRQRTGDIPVLFLDDVFSELDSDRQGHLLTSISPMQTVLTCTGMDEFIQKNVQIDRKFYVENGTVSVDSAG